MPVYRCAACGFVGEESSALAGSKLPCAKCASGCTLFATPFYVERLVERYLAARRELDALKVALGNPARGVIAGQCIDGSPDTAASR